MKKVHSEIDSVLYPICPPNYAVHTCILYSQQCCCIILGIRIMCVLPMRRNCFRKQGNENLSQMSRLDKHAAEFLNNKYFR